MDADLELSLQRVREKVTDAQKELPEEAEDSTVSEISFSDIPILLVSVVGDMDPVLLKRLAENVADELALIPEVLSTDVAGGRTREIHIYLDPNRLSQFGLTILDVYNAIKQSDINIPGGMVNIPERRFLLRTLTEIKKVVDYERVPLIRQGDRVVFLGDVGIVKDGHQEDISYSRVDGESSVSIAVKKRAGANILQTSAKVRTAIETMQDEFPAGVRMVVTADQAKYIQQGFDTMNNSAVTGLIIVIIVLYFAMGFRNSIITSLSIPLSLLITFILLKVFGQTNNNMVRFSLVLCIGLLVDNAIIVVENVYHHYQLGKERLAAVIDGVSEIAAPVVSATLTTMAAFLPILLMTGTTGEYMGYLPKTVTIALSASLIVSLIANPLLLSRFMKRSVKDGRIVRPEEDLAFLKKIYVRLVIVGLESPFCDRCADAFQYGLGHQSRRAECGQDRNVPGYRFRLHLYPYRNPQGHGCGDHRPHRQAGGKHRCRDGARGQPGGFDGGVQGPERVRAHLWAGHRKPFRRNYGGASGRQGVCPCFPPGDSAAHQRAAG